MGQADLRENKRLWHFTHHPKTFEASCPVCGESDDITWSEWQGHLWCYKCKEDVPVKNSVLNGPVPTGLAIAMGMNFDIRIIATGEIKKYDAKTGTHEL